MGSMNMPGISLTLLNLTNVSEECSIPVSKLLDMLDAPHNSPAWPCTQNMYPVSQALEGRKRQDAWVDVKKEEKPPRKESKQILGTSSATEKSPITYHNDNARSCVWRSTRLTWW